MSGCRGVTGRAGLFGFLVFGKTTFKKLRGIYYLLFTIINYIYVNEIHCKLKTL